MLRAGAEACGGPGAHAAGAVTAPPLTTYVLLLTYYYLLTYYDLLPLKALSQLRQQELPLVHRARGLEVAVFRF